jgi:hypothetical protein
LATARSWDLSPAAILSQLDDRFATLRHGPGDLPARLSVATNIDRHVLADMIRYPGPDPEHTLG